ncbi:DUF5071 domain-containing protein [Paenibacillus gorillae]|uniref:DUF5071 domain-containing protein n=1 Tax=Paenibacillus gorillae TaxID=1243662 RepID=UPI0004AE56DC|nr:DUF5071 domain-containing protein [Paenibacillus gorillae]
MQMNDTFLPKDKHDIESVEVLSGLEGSLVLPLLPKLLEWLQDFNWPVAPVIVDVISKYKSETIPYIQEILSMRDMIWTYNILAYLIQDWDTVHVSVLSASLRELAQTMDYDEGTDLLAIETMWKHRLIEENDAKGLLAEKLSEIEETLQGFTSGQIAEFSDLEDENLLRRYEEIEVLISSIANP